MSAATAKRGALMAMLRCGARAGAAVFVLGLSVAGPYTVGVAAADRGSGDSART